MTRFVGTPDDPSNLQVLMHHLRELQTARQVLVEKLHFQHPAALTAAAGCNSIVIMKALDCHTRSMRNLKARLMAAAEKQTGQCFYDINAAEAALQAAAPPASWQQDPWLFQ